MCSMPVDSSFRRAVAARPRSSCGRAHDLAEVDAAQALDVVELDAPRPQRDPVVRRLGHHHRFGVAGKHDARDAELAGLREHVGRQRVADAEGALGHRVAGGRRDDHRVVDVVVQHAHRHARWPSCRATAESRGRSAASVPRGAARRSAAPLRPRRTGTGRRGSRAASASDSSRKWPEPVMHQAKRERCCVDRGFATVRRHSGCETSMWSLWSLR